jgi:AcrR family transcriptional regulator
LPTLSAIVSNPRKQPVQARSTATVDAILEATLQVLIAVGKDRLTTTRVAERAGVSVGTLYQYYPNKTSLLQAILKRKLEGATEAIEHACATHRGEPLAAVIPAVVRDFFRAKMKNPRGSLALYAVSSDVDGIRATEELRIRSTRAFIDVIQHAPEQLSISAQLAAFMLQSAMTGLSRRMLEAKLPASEHEPLIVELIAMLTAYVGALKK